MTNLMYLTSNGAILSDCDKYRYRLWRYIGGSKGPVLFVMLNPSTADETIDDPTIRRCISFAKLWDHNSLLVGNLFAFRATDPKQMKQAEDPVGSENNQHLIEMSKESCLTVSAWGTHGNFLNRSAEVIKILDTEHNPLQILKITKQGYPSHPLYLPKNLIPSNYRQARKELNGYAL